MPDYNGVVQAVCQQILGGSSARELTSLEAAALERAVLRSGLTISPGGVWDFAVPPTFAGGSGVPSAHHTSHESGGSDPVQLAESQVTNLVSDLALKAPIASPTFTGTPTGVTPPQGDYSLRFATTQFVFMCLTGSAGLADVPLTALDPTIRMPVYRLDATGDRTVTISGAGIGQQKVIIVHKALGAPRTLTLQSGAGQFRLPSSIVVTQTAANQTDYIGTIFNDIDNRWDVVAYTKGFA